MAIQQDWGKTNLADYLQHESWKTSIALNILAWDLTLDPPFPDEYELLLVEKARKFNLLKTAWYEKPLTFKRLSAGAHSPDSFIEWAISKNLPPAWLDWAIVHKLYPLATLETEPVKLHSPGTEEAKPVLTSEPVTKTNKLRRNCLDPAIDKAIKLAENMQLADVYLQLKELALAGEKPFTGALDGNALCYTDDNTNNEKKFTKEALGARLKRAKKPTQPDDYDGCRHLPPLDDGNRQT